MKLEELELHNTPAVFATGGVVYTDAGSFTPFPGYTGPLTVDTDGDRIYVGAGVGGGPRVAAFDSRGTRLFDRFVFEPSFRGGVEVAADGGHVYVTPGDGGGPVLVTLDRDLTEQGRRFVGDPNARGGLRVGAATAAPVGPTQAVPVPQDDNPHVTYGNGPVRVELVFEDSTGRDTRGQVAAGVWNLLQPFADLLTLSTDRDYTRPWAVLTVEVLPHITAAGEPDNAAGFAGFVLDPATASVIDRPTIYATVVDTITPRIVAHEFGHANGLGHVQDPTDIMYPVAEYGAAKFSDSEVQTIRSNLQAFAARFQL